MAITQTICWKAFWYQFQKMWEAPSQTLIIIGALLFVWPYAKSLIMQSYINTEVSCILLPCDSHISKTMCTSIFQEVVNYYNRNGSNVYACLVDASKAFDRINYSKLFQKILKRNLPGTIMRLHFDSYTRQQSFVKWGQEFSNVIYMHNRVKQGSVLSATLICIYMDELLSRLERSGIGCHIGNNYYGNISYADDLKLLCPSINGLQNMLDICDIFSKEYFVTYNAHKTIAICYGKTSENPKRSLHLNGSSIRWETSVKYLGNMHCSSMSDCNDVTYKKHVYISSVNKLNCHFAFASSATKAKLLQTYCSAWYGSQNWQLNTEAVRGFHTECNKAVRRTLGFPACTRSQLLPHLANNQSFTAHIEYRWIQFYKCMLSSENEKVSYIARRSLENSIGCLGKNRIHIRSKFDLININDMSWIPKEPINSIDYARSQVIKELLDVKEGNSHISFFHN